mmetsp:Transcript_100420/g.156864  ORF Transcript_100420/g.156864 Transcript_100420/m.156864 type:complete len:321 (+) Transcript_100420:75-1037(+)
MNRTLRALLQFTVLSLLAKVRCYGSGILRRDSKHVIVTVDSMGGTANLYESAASYSDKYKVGSPVHVDSQANQADVDIKKSSRSVVIVGALRSAEQQFVKSLDSLRSICEKFISCTMLIVENDSNDGTASALKAYAKQYKNIMVLMGEGLDVVSSSRTRHLATARNLLLDFVQENYASRDFLIMADLDGMTFEPVEAFMKPLSEQGWDVMTYNSANYYDFWALRCGSRTENCWNRAPNTCYDEFPCIRDLQRGASRVEVDSAFQGIAVYKIPMIGSCKYNGTNAEPHAQTDEDCEHVAFHRCLRSQGAKIHISASRLRIW